MSRKRERERETVRKSRKLCIIVFHRVMFDYFAWAIALFVDFDYLDLYHSIILPRSIQ